MLFQVKIGKIQRNKPRGDCMVEIEQRLSKSLQGFQLSRNEAAEYLMRELGIQFPQVPPKVELNLRNRIRWAKEKGIGGVIAGTVTRGAVAAYDRRYGAVFVPKDDLFAELHEDGHALVDSINPQIRDLVDELPVMVTQRIARQPINLDNVERIVTYRCFDEGVAQWGALRTARRLTEHFEPEDVLSMENSMLHGTKDDQQTNFKQEQSRAVRQAVSAYKAALSQTGPKVMIEGMKAESQLSDSQYVAGYHFVDEAMNILINSGRQVGEALTGIIKKPPERIDDLERPQEYLVRVKP